MEVYDLELSNKRSYLVTLVVLALVYNAVAYACLRSRVSTM